MKRVRFGLFWGIVAALWTQAATAGIGIDVIGARGTGAQSAYKGQQVKFSDQVQGGHESRSICLSMITGATAFVDGNANRVTGYSETTALDAGSVTALGASIVFPPELTAVGTAAVTEFGGLCAEGAYDGYQGRMGSEVSGTIGTSPVLECRVGAPTCTQRNRGSMSSGMVITDRTNSYRVDLLQSKASMDCGGSADCMRVEFRVTNTSASTLFCSGFMVTPDAVASEFAPPVAPGFGRVAIAPNQSRALNYLGPRQDFDGMSFDTPTGGGFAVGASCARCATPSVDPACLFSSTEAPGGGVGQARNSADTVNTGDTVPDAFAFASQSGVSSNATVTSAPVTPTGYSLAAPISVVNGQYGINCANFTSNPGTIGPGQSVCARHTSASGGGQTVSTLVSIGGVQGSFSSTTAGGGVDTVPDPFFFPAKQQVTAGATVTSDSVTPIGYNAPASVTVTGGQYGIDCANFTSAPGTISPGQSICARHVAAAGNGETATTMVSIGGQTATFASTTAGGQNGATGPFSDLTVVTKVATATRTGYLEVAQQCPAGYTALSGGIETDGLTITTLAPTFGDQVLYHLPMGASHALPDGWYASLDVGAAPSSVGLAVVCARLNGAAVVMVSSGQAAYGSDTRVEALCPEGMRAVGGGIDVERAGSISAEKYRISATQAMNGVGGPVGWAGAVYGDPLTFVVAPPPGPTFKVGAVCIGGTDATVSAQVSTDPVSVTVGCQETGKIAIAGGLTATRRYFTGLAPVIPEDGSGSIRTIPSGQYPPSRRWHVTAPRDYSEGWPGLGAGVVCVTASLPNVPTATVYEFYNSSLRHYFRTADPGEAAAIENGAAGPGWSRTQDDFQAYAAGSGAPGSDICRFYTRGANSHFYTGNASECEGLKNPNSGWIYEGLAFRIRIPTSSQCGSGEKPIYRVYNNRYMYNDANHRFTSRADFVQQMVAQGWVAEGVAFCALGS